MHQTIVNVPIKIQQASIAIPTQYYQDDEQHFNEHAKGSLCRMLAEPIAKAASISTAYDPQHDTTTISATVRVAILKDTHELHRRTTIYH